MDWRAARARGGRRRRVVARSARGSQPGGERDGRARGARARWTETACEDISRVLRARRCLLRATRPSRSSHGVSPSEVKCVSSSPKRVVVSRPRPTLRFRRHRRPRACPTGRPASTSSRRGQILERRRLARARRVLRAGIRLRRLAQEARKVLRVAPRASPKPTPRTPPRHRESHVPDQTRCALTDQARSVLERPRDGWSTPFGQRAPRGRLERASSGIRRSGRS